MQKLTCEVCGSNDLQRTDDGFFQCQYCGCKYTLEQAKSLLGTVETTIGDAELNRRVENAKAQIRIGQPAEETIGSIIKDFPASPKGYLLFFENYFEKILKDKTEMIYSQSGKCNFYFDLNNFDTSKYDSLYAIAKDSSEITAEELDKFFDGYFTKLFNSLVNGEISDNCIRSGNKAPHPIAKKAYETGVNNERLLKANNIGIYSRCDSPGLFYGVDKNWGIQEASFCLGKYWYEIYHMPIKPLILNESNIGEIVKLAKNNTRKMVAEKGVCLCCGKKLSRMLIGNGFKCKNPLYESKGAPMCGATFNLNDLV